jgi:CRP-like cAMP-binding protein
VAGGNALLQTSRQGTGRNWPNDTFLHRLSEGSRTELLSLGLLRTFPPSHVLLRQGDDGASVWLLIDALVKVSAGMENGSQALLAVRVSGDVVGEMAVIDGSTRSATVTTAGHAVVSQIKGPVFVDFIRRHPPVALALHKMTVERLRWSNQRRLEFAGYETDARLARVLLALAGRHGRPVDGGIYIGVPLTHGELGGLVGAREGTVQKALRELAAAGLVRSGRRKVLITDLPALSAFANLRQGSHAVEGG